MLIAEDSPKYQGRAGHRDRTGRQGRPGYDIPERLLARLWRQRAARQAWLRTAGGARVRVLYPGRPGGGAGPDFREALLEVEGQGLVRGDVELHVQQRDWSSHGHSGDPNYNGVVLHAVLGVESNSTTLHNGGEAPVVSLAPLLDGEEEGTPSGDGGEEQLVSLAPLTEGGEDGAPGRDGGEESGVSGYLWGLLETMGYPRPGSLQEAGALLDRAGEQRFEAKRMGYARLLDETGRGQAALEQALYEAMMEGLGYRANQQGFLGLAQRAPWRRLVELSGGLEREEAQPAVQSWLALVSGLRSGAESPGGLPKGLGPPLAPGDWRLSGLRPPNHPLRRMAGAAAWVQRFGERGLARGLRLTCESGSPAGLTKALQVDGPEGGGAPIGKGRARDIAVNVVLPFLQAADPDVSTGSRYQSLYLGFGKLQENELTKEMSRRLLPTPWRSAANSARRQQGLLHLQRLLAGAS